MNTTDAPAGLVRKIADEFSRRIRIQLDADELFGVIELSEAENDPTMRHLADYCDELVALEDALLAVTGTGQIDPENEAQVRMIRDAVDLAKAERFRFAKRRLLGETYT